MSSEKGPFANSTLKGENENGSCAKELIICSSGTVHIFIQPSASKIFVSFPVFTFKNPQYIANCQFKLAAICRHVVCLLQSMLKVEKIPEIT